MPMSHCVIKKLLNPSQIHHPLSFANSPFKSANCPSTPPLLGKFTPNLLVFYAPHPSLPATKKIFKKLDFSVNSHIIICHP